MRLHLQFSAFAQFLAFAGVGLAAAVAHYGLLIGLVQGAGWSPVPAALCGYIAGGVVSYVLNRAHVFETERSNLESGWRFALVAFGGFCLTWLCMRFMVESYGLPYLPAQVATTCIVMFWSFIAHKFWTFGGSAPP